MYILKFCFPVSWLLKDNANMFHWKSKMWFYFEWYQYIFFFCLILNVKVIPVICDEGEVFLYLRLFNTVAQVFF